MNISRNSLSYVKNNAHMTILSIDLATLNHGKPVVFVCAMCSLCVLKQKKKFSHSRQHHPRNYVSLATRSKRKLIYEQNEISVLYRIFINKI